MTAIGIIGVISVFGMGPFGTIMADTGVRDVPAGQAVMQPVN